MTKGNPMETRAILETLELADATLTSVANVFGGLTGPNGCDTLPARRAIWTAIVAVREAMEHEAGETLSSVPCDCPPPPPVVGWECPCGGSCPGCHGGAAGVTRFVPDDDVVLSRVFGERGR